MRLALRLSILAALAAPVAAQIPVNVTLGPNPLPVGARLSMTFSHDGPNLVSTGGCPFSVYDSSMSLVWEAGCTPVAIAVGPYGVLTRYWDQTDMNGQQVPPGDYYIRTDYDFQGPTFDLITIDPGAEAGVTLEGTPSIGNPLNGADRNFFLTSPQDPGEAYWLFASLSTNVGVPTCNGTIPLDFDPLFVKSLSPTKIFQQSLGFLGATGETKAPRFAIPDDPTLVGISLFAAFSVVDFDLPCAFLRHSGTHAMTII